MEEYLHVIKEGENIYYLNAKGREMVNCEKVRKKLTTYQHYIMRNYLYIALGCPVEWKNEVSIINGYKNDKVSCRTDALIQKGDFYTIIEVDHEQKMIENIKKIDKYRILRQRGAFGLLAPRFVWMTTTDYRKNELLKASEGLNVEVYTIEDFKGRK